jgi:hypothetical protein
MTELPESLRAVASFDGNELAWPVEAFPAVLDTAAAAGFACLGGQFQFRFPDGLFEMYWLNADSNDQQTSESWSAYVERARNEVLATFERIVAETDFHQEAKACSFLNEKLQSGTDIMDALCFCAYFISKDDNPSTFE